MRNMIVSSPNAYDLLEETKGYLINGLIGLIPPPHIRRFLSGGEKCFPRVTREMPVPIRSLMLAGNIYDLLKNIEIGTDVGPLAA